MRNTWGVPVTVCLALAAAGPVRADDQADLKALLARAIKAHGGEKKLARYKAFTMKYKGKSYIVQEADYTAELAVQYPDQMKSEITVEAGGMTLTFATVLNKDKGWRKMNDSTTALDKDQLKEEKEGMYAQRVTRLVGLGGKGYKLSTLGETKVGDKPAVGLTVSHKGHRDINLYFDKKTHLLLKASYQVKDMGSDKEVEQEIFYQDYKKAEGVQRASKIRIKRDGKKWVDVDEVTEFRLVDKLDDSEFAKP
jgi:hypothetical protein